MDALDSFEDLEYITSMKDKLSKLDHGIHPQTMDLMYSDYLQEEDPTRKADEKDWNDQRRQKNGGWVH